MTEDVLVVFEDDAVVAVQDVEVSLTNEFTHMDTDLVYLGWCHGKNIRKPPMCTHAYALRRSGVHILMKQYDVCGAAIDEQLRSLARQGILTSRRAMSDSYSKLKAGFDDKDHVNGIFRQLKKLHSVNFH